MEVQKKKHRTSNAVKYRWNKKTYKTFRFNLRYDKDSELIDFINQQPSKNEFIKNCIKSYIANNK